MRRSPSAEYRPAQLSAASTFQSSWLQAADYSPSGNELCRRRLEVSSLLPNIRSVIRFCRVNHIRRILVQSMQRPQLIFHIRNPCREGCQRLHNPLPPTKLTRPRFTRHNLRRHQSHLLPLNQSDILFILPTSLPVLIPNHTPFTTC